VPVLSSALCADEAPDGGGGVGGEVLGLVEDALRGDPVHTAGAGFVNLEEVLRF
jgi:hypothetical protein